MTRLPLRSLGYLGLVLGLGLATACGDDDDDDGAGGSAGTSAGGSAGTSAGGSGGSTSGSGGTGAGTAGTAGTGAGTAGTSAGTAGTGAGTAGTAGAGGESGAAGAAGEGGTGGTAGGAAGTGGAGGTAGAGGASGAAGGASFSFFVSSTGSTTANLGGLGAADKRCQDLATAVGAGGKTWRAYLSVEKGPNDAPINARDRIGSGPWYNAKLGLVAADLTSLHERFGDADVFLDEKGAKVNGQWAGSPTPNEHDILTGTRRDGTVDTGKTCGDWTSADATRFATVGHSDGLGPGGSDDPMYRPWNAVHDNGSCADTAPKGGSGRIYCFAAD